jgi:hypothetical protein
LNYRKLFRAVETLIKTDGDVCSICRAPFVHNCRTFGGESLEGQPALVGDCCRSRLQRQVSVGLYLKHSGYDELFPRGGTAGEVSAEVLEKAVTIFQQMVAETDDCVRRAGLPATVRPQVSVDDAIWKTDDAAWFAANPTRSHRLRPVFAGEVEAIGRTLPDLAGYQHAAMVRQVEPGRRIKHMINLNTAIEVPDIEAVLHALFDQAASGGDLSVATVAELALQYAAVGRSP